jgi:hypothetical protein
VIHIYNNKQLAHDAAAQAAQSFILAKGSQLASTYNSAEVVAATGLDDDVVVVDEDDDDRLADA